MLHSKFTAHVYSSSLQLMYGQYVNKCYPNMSSAQLGNHCSMNMYLTMWKLRSKNKALGVSY